MAHEDASPALPDLGDSIDGPTFEQILEMDDEEDEREFSRSIVYGFFDQAQGTFKDIDQSLKAEDLEKLSSLGHYLKGSSATLGLNHMKNSCEKIQHWGKKKDETGTKSESADQCLSSIKAELGKLKKEYARVEVGLRKFYGETT